MSQGWENHEPAPIEFFHSLAMDLFHKLRIERGNNPDYTVSMTGTDFGNIIAAAKVETYKRYPKQVSSEAILKTEL